MKTCKSCSTALGDFARFCPKCGETVRAEESPTVSVLTDERDGTAVTSQRLSRPTGTQSTTAAQQGFAAVPPSAIRASAPPTPSRGAVPTPPPRVAAPTPPQRPGASPTTSATVIDSASPSQEEGSAKPSPVPAVTSGSSLGSRRVGLVVAIAVTAALILFFRSGDDISEPMNDSVAPLQVKEERTANATAPLINKSTSEPISVLEPDVSRSVTDPIETTSPGVTIGRAIAPSSNDSLATDKDEVRSPVSATKYLEIRNVTGYTFKSLYIRAKGAQSWGQNILELKALESNNAYRAGLPDSLGEVFDLRACDEQMDEYVVWSIKSDMQNIDVSTRDLSRTPCQ